MWVEIAGNDAHIHCFIALCRVGSFLDPRWEIALQEQMLDELDAPGDLIGRHAEREQLRREPGVELGSMRVEPLREPSLQLHVAGVTADVRHELAKSTLKRRHSYPAQIVLQLIERPA